MPLSYLKGMNFTPISEIGRDGLLDRIKAAAVNDQSEVVLGIGDDAAVLRLDFLTDLLISSETLIEGVDVDLTWHPLPHWGYKVVTAGVSDVLAMGGVPTVVTVGLSLTTKFSVEMVEAFYQGVREACLYYGCDLVGGDLRSAVHAAVFSVSALGQSKRGGAVSRKGAKVGDAICVSGTVGDALAGLKILLREKRFWAEHPEAQQPSLDAWSDVVGRQLLPKARIDLVRGMREHGIRPSAMADLSKGLLNELLWLCRSSDVGAYLYEAALPISDATKDVAREMGERAEAYALQGGEDFELLFTLPEDAVDRAFEVLKDLTVVGMVAPKEDGVRIQKFSGEVWELDRDERL